MLCRLGDETQDLQDTQVGPRYGCASISLRRLWGPSQLPGRPCLFAPGFESTERTTPSSAHRLVHWSLRLVGYATCLASDYEPHCDRSFNAILETSAKVYRELM